MYDLFIANKNYSSWSLRPWLLMRQLGLPFTEHMRVFGEGSNRAVFKAFSPTGKVPCLHADGQVVWDSLAIVEYLAERHAGVWPSDASARTWARSACAEMHSGFALLREACSMNCGLRVKLHAPEWARIQDDLLRLDALWAEGLSRFGGPWLAGASFSAVDAYFAPMVFRMQTYGLILSAPAIAYADRLLALPGMRQWLGEALKEPWREQGHEDESLQHGCLLADLR